MMHPRTFRRASSALLISILAVSCKDGPPSPASVIAAGPVTLEATVGTSTTQRPQVKVVDDKGNPYPGFPVTFAVTSGGGTLTRTTDTTDAQGVAVSGNWLLGEVAGPNTVTATAQGLAGSPLTFTATGTAGNPTALTIVAGDAQTAVAGTAVATLPSVKVTDRFGNGVPGAPVGFTVTAGGGSVTGGSTTTNASGIATVGSWTLGAAVGANVLTITSAPPGGANSFAVTLGATGIAGPATKLTIIRPPAGAASGNVLVHQPVVRVTDANGNVITSATGNVSAALASGSGTLSGTQTVAAVNGVATFTNLAITGTGAATLSFSATGLTAATSPSFTVAAPPGPAAKLAIFTQPAGASSSSPFTTQPEIEIQDANGTPIAGATNAVTASLASGSGTLNGTKTVSAVNGVATFSDLRIDGSGASQITFSATGLTSATSGSFAVDPPLVATLQLFAGDKQAVMAGSAVPVKPAVRALTSANTPAAGARINFTVTAGGGAVTGGTVITDANGIATVGGWTTGGAGGFNGMSATVDGMVSAATTVTFGASGCFGSGAGFKLTLCITTDMSLAQRTAFVNAASRWEGIITAESSDEVLPSGAGPTTGCNSNGYAVASGFSVDDLLIFASVVDIDGPGQVLGSAGFCLIRRAGGSLAPGDFPVVGAMRFDAADLTNLETGGGLGAVILHEMGHVLGIGSLWNAFGFTKNPSNSSSSVDTYFSGVNAIAGFDAIGGSTYTGGQKVPVENTGGGGTINVHWRESVLKSELMTGFLSQSANPLSVLTVRSLQDLGYTVNVSAADALNLTLSIMAPGATIEKPIALGNDVDLGPLFALDRRGRLTRIR